jgi:23S rRNA (adenine2503-C2)-methyltransferase
MGQPDAAGWGNKRGTLCVSSQVGCQMGCTFCATGAQRWQLLLQQQADTQQHPVGRHAVQQSWDAALSGSCSTGM